MKKQNHRMDFYKFMMTIFCALMHFEGWFFPADRRVFEGGYLAVDFFFVLSGFLIYNSYRSGKYISALDFTWKRFKKFFPYATTIVLGFVLIQFFHDVIEPGFNVRGAILWVAETGIDLVGELSFLQMFLPWRGFNFVTWYVSVLLVIGFIFYEYLEQKRNDSSGLLLLFFLLTVHYLISTYGNLDVNMGDTKFIGQYPGLIRGAAEMGAGIFGAKVLENIDVDKIDKRWLLLEYALFIFLVLILFIYPHSKYDAIFVIGCVVLVPLAFANDISCKYNKIFKIIGKLSFTMFFCQNFVRLIWYYLDEKYGNLTNCGFGMTMLLFFCSLVSVAVLLEIVVKWEKRVVNRLIKK